MKIRCLPQEGLKLIACAAMLLDHIGAVFCPGIGLRIIGRIAFPIYCFLLAEGIHYTREPRKYGLRLLVGALLSEIPFDLLFFGKITLAHASVMVTLLLGFLYGQAAKRATRLAVQILLILPFAVAAELLGTDYGGWGIALVALFVLSRGREQARGIQMIVLAFICWMIGGYTLRFGSVRIPIEMAALAALIPIFCYSGQKTTKNTWIQRGFYLFYPVHLMILLCISQFA